MSTVAESRHEPTTWRALSVIRMALDERDPEDSHRSLALMLAADCAADGGDGGVVARAFISAEKAARIERGQAHAAEYYGPDPTTWPDVYQPARWPA